jgi:hypothetical protein
MKFRFNSKYGTEIPPLQQSLEDIQGRLADQQQQWAAQLAKDPAAFAALEQQIHLTFQQRADRCAASLLAHAAAAPACPDAAKKK